MGKVNLYDPEFIDTDTIYPDTQEFRLSFTELGNAERLVNSYGDILKYSEQIGKWYMWDGYVWKVDNVRQVEDYAKKIILELYQEATELSDDNRKKMVIHIKNSEKHHSIQNMLALASSDPRIRIDISDLDNKPHLLNCTNVTIDLSGKEFKVRTLSKNDLLSQSTGIIYDKKAECPKWKEFLSKLFLGNEKLIDFIQSTVGYLQTGYTSEDCLFFLYGNGANGKSTFVELLKILFGDYYRKSSIDTITLRRGNLINNDIARLKSARLVVCSEVEQSNRLAESLVKDLTGGDTITARYLYKEYFEFNPTFKLMIFGNYKPKIKGSDVGIRRRIRLIPFEYTFKENEKRSRDEILQELRSEISGILNWALEGFNKWRTEGLKTPLEIVDATNTYLKEMDTIKSFIEERCLIQQGDMGQEFKSESFKEIYNGYRNYCQDVGEYVLTQREFNENLKMKGFENKRLNSGFCWIGLMLKQEYRQIK